VREGDKAIYTPIRDFDCAKLHLTVNKDYEGEVVVSNDVNGIFVKFLNDIGKEYCDCGSIDDYIASTAVVALLPIHVYRARVTEQYHQRLALLTEQFTEDAKVLKDEFEESIRRTEETFEPVAQVGHQ
jgi:hypothetical protein